MNLTCRELINFLMDYLEGELSKEVRECFEEHLEICPSCVAYLNAYRETIQLEKLVMQHPDDALPDDVPEELIQAILAARMKQGGDHRAR